MIDDNKHSVTYYLGYMCNLDCTYCNLEKRGDNSHIKNGIKPFEEMLERQKKFNKEIDKIILSGGEPTLFKKEVLEILKKYSSKYKFVLISNGVDLNTLKEFLAFPVDITISYDGHENDRGFDSFSTLKELDKIGRLTGISLVISNGNYHNISDTISELITEFPWLLFEENLPHSTKGLLVGLARCDESFYNFDKDIFREQIRKLYKLVGRKINIFKNRTSICKGFWSADSDLICSHSDGKPGENGCHTGVKNLEETLQIYEANCGICKAKICNLKGCPKSISFMSVGKEKSTYCQLNLIIQEEIDLVDNNKFLEGQLGTATTIELILTDSCNLNCKYCFQKNCHSNNVMKEEVIDATFAKTIEKNKYSCRISLFGGEPILPSTLKTRQYILGKIKALTTKKPSVAITSNTFLVTDADLEWLAELKKETTVFWQVSLDGVKEFNDISRVDHSGNGTFETVIKNLKRVASVIGKGHVSINTVMTKENMPGIKDWCEFLTSEIFGKHAGGVSFRTDQSRNEKMNEIEKTILKNMLSDIVSSYLDGKIHNQIVKNMFNLKRSSYDENLTKMIDQHSSCGVCKNSIVIEPNGNIIPCHTFDSRIDDTVIIGNILNGYCNPNIVSLYEKLGSVDDQYSELINLQCNKCEFKLECVRCKIEHLRKNGDIAKTLLYPCEFVRNRGSFFRNSELYERFKPLSREEENQLISDINELADMYQETKNKEVGTLLVQLSNMKKEKQWFI